MANVMPPGAAGKGKKLVPLRAMRKSTTRKKSLKNILFVPYRLNCPVVSNADEQEISKELKEVIDSLVEANKLSRKTGDHDNKSEIREQLVIGINAVTRALEHNKLRLLLVDRDSEPPLLTRHLIGLSALHACPAVWISGLTKLLSRRLGITSLVALAFKKRSQEDDEAFDTLVSFIAGKAPENKLPWLDRLPGTKTEAVEDNITCQRSSENKGGTQYPGQTQTGASSTLDYSRLYVLKSESKLTNGKVQKSGFSHQGFLAFGSDSDCEEDIKQKPVKVGKIKKRGAKGETRYFTATVGKLMNNPDREMQKEIKKKKKEKNKNTTAKRKQD